MALVQDITERKRLQDRLELERGHLRLLLEVNNAVVSNIELRPLFAAITASLRKVIRHEYTSLALYDADSRRLRLHVYGERLLDRASARAAPDRCRCCTPR